MMIHNNFLISISNNEPFIYFHNFDFCLKKTYKIYSEIIYNAFIDEDLLFVLVSNNFSYSFSFEVINLNNLQLIKKIGNVKIDGNSPLTWVRENALIVKIFNGKLSTDYYE